MAKTKIFHKDVDYTALTQVEKDHKASRELFTILYLAENRGLTDYEIHRWARWLKFSGFNGLQPDAVVRSNINWWNSNTLKTAGGVMCSGSNCKSYACWGYEQSVPMTCRKHSNPDMKRVMEIRMFRAEKESGMSKGKYYFDKDFAARVWENPPVFDVEQQELQEKEERAKLLDTKLELSVHTPSTAENIEDMFADLDRFDKLYQEPMFETKPIMTMDEIEKILVEDNEVQQMDFDIEKNDEIDDDFFNKFLNDMNDPFGVSVPFVGNALLFGIVENEMSFNQAQTNISYT